MKPRDTDERESLSSTLVERLRGGDTRAGRSLEELYFAELRRFTARYLGNEHDAEDAVQEVFIKVLETRTVPTELRAWLYRVARNVCLNRLRSRGRRKDSDRLQTGIDLPVDQVGELTRIVAVEEGMALRDKLLELSDAQREVLVLRYLEGLSREEIAEVLEVNVSVVKSRLFEGVSRLRG